MIIPVNKTVTYPVCTVEFLNMRLYECLDQLVFVIPYTWYDVDKEILRTGRNTYMENTIVTQFSAVGIDVTPVMTSLHMMVSSDYVIAYFRFPSNEEMLLSVTYMTLISGSQTWHTERYTNDTIDNYLTSYYLNRDTINYLLCSFTLGIFG